MVYVVLKLLHVVAVLVFLGNIFTQAGAAGSSMTLHART